MGLPEEMGKSWFKVASDTTAEDSASRAICKICVANGKASASRALCAICNNRVPSLSKTKAAGGKSFKAAGAKSFQAAGKENEAKPAGVVMVASSNKVKAAEPVKPSRPVAQVWKEKPASRELIQRTAYEWLTKYSKPAKEDPPSRPCCKVCTIISEICDDQVVGGCKICVAKAAALDRIKACGGDYIKVEDGKAKPAGLVKASSLAEKEVISTATEDREGKLVTIVTVRMPFASIRDVMRLPPRRPLRPLPEDFFEEDPELRKLGVDHIDLREPTLAGAASVLFSIQTEENTLAQFFEKGYATLKLQVVEG